MLLVIDIGNTNIVLGGIEKKLTYFIERVSTDKRRTELEYAVMIKSVLEIYGISELAIGGSILSSVVPQLTDVVKSAVEKVLDLEVMVVGPGIRTGLNIHMDYPSQLGSDLVVDAVAAISEHPVPLVVIDMGTATTLSVIDERKRYIGGMILPGVQTASDSLTSSAAQLHQINLETPKKLIGSNTIDCMKSGAMYGNAASIDGLIDRIEEELGTNCTVIATGGLARIVVPLCRREIILDDNLLLKGLQVIYEKNAAPAKKSSPLHRSEAAK